MIAQIIYLPQYDWTVVVYYCQEGYCKSTILNTLKSSGCTKDILGSINDIMNEGLNTGFTYSNEKHRTSYMAIGPADSSKEFQNTYAHEKGHTVSYIAEACSIDFTSEEYQYLMGDLSESMFEIAQRYLCDDCEYSKVREA